MIELFIKSLFWAFAIETYIASLQFLPNQSGVFPLDELLVAMAITYTIFTIILVIHCITLAVKALINKLIAKFKNNKIKSV